MTRKPTIRLHRLVPRGYAGSYAVILGELHIGYVDRVLSGWKAMGLRHGGPVGCNPIGRFPTRREAVAALVAEYRRWKREK